MYSEYITCFYIRPRFRALTIRVVVSRSGISESVTMRVYHTGKVVLAGARTTHAAMIAANRLVEMFQKINIPCRVCNFRTQNRVFSIALGFPVDVELMGRELPDKIIISPVFPARTYKSSVDAAVVQLYPTGNGVLVGADTFESAKRLYVEVFHAARPYQPKRLRSTPNAAGFMYTHGGYLTMEQINRSLLELKKMNLYHDPMDDDSLDNIVTPEEMNVRRQQRLIESARGEEESRALAPVTPSHSVSDVTALNALLKVLE